MVRSRYSTFMLDIWSLYDEVILRRKSFHFGQLRLQVICYFWKFSVWPPNLQPWSLACQMRLIWTWMRPFKPFPTFQSIKSGTVDHSWLSRVSGWLNNDWWLLSIQSLAKPLQNDPWTIWAWKINPRALSQWKWHLLAWLTDSPDQLTWFINWACTWANGQCNVMQWTMLC